MKNATKNAVATILAAYAGLVGAALAVQLSAYPGPPATAQAVAAAMVAVPRQPHDVPGPVVHCELICPDWDGQDDVVAVDGPWDRTDRVLVYFDVEPGYVAEARQRLLAAGWRVEGIAQPAGGGQLSAAKGGLRLDIQALAEGPFIVLVHKGPSAAAVALLVAGFAGGALAGWVVARRVRRKLVALAGFPVLVIGAPSVALAVMLTVAAAVAPGPHAKMVQLPMFVLTAFPPATAIAVAGAVLALVAALVPERRRSSEVAV